MSVLVIIACFVLMATFFFTKTMLFMFRFVKIAIIVIILGLLAITGLEQCDGAPHGTVEHHPIHPRGTVE